jgi:hypothetical protein
VDQAVLTLAAFDDSVLPSAPSFGPSVFSPQNGCAVFRSGWGEDDTYLIMMAEQGIAAGFAYRYDGEPLEGAGGHEHSDPGATHMMAHGEVLLLDSGYLGWENHSKVNKPKNHNLILVDSRGPQSPWLSIPPFTIEDGGVVILDPSREGGYVPGEDSEAFLQQGFSTAFLEHARVDSRYAANASPTGWNRRMVFVDQTYFLQADVAVAEDGQPHEFDLLAHLNGGGTTGASQPVDSGGRVVRDAASLEVRVASARGPATLSTTQDVHDAWHWREETHTVLHSAVQAPSAAFLTVYYPLAAGEDVPVIEKIAEGSGAAAFRIGRSSGSEVAVLAEPGAAEVTAGSVTLKGSFAFAGGQDADRLLLGDGTALAAGLRSIGLDQTGTVAVRWENGSVSGYYSGPPNRLTLMPVSGAAAGEGFCGIQAQGNQIVLDLPGDGPFSVSSGSGNHAPLAVISVADSGKTGERIAMDGTGSCDADGEALTYTWRLVNRPVRSNASVEQANAATVHFVPDWPGHYRVGLVVSDGTDPSREVTALVFVERFEPATDGGVDGGGGDGTSGGGCGCSSGTGNGWILLLLLIYSPITLTRTRLFRRPSNSP